MRYKEQSISGTKWVRAHSVQITNPVSGTPEISFLEESITALADGREMHEPCGTLATAFNNPAATFQILNPVTREPIPGVTMTHQDVYVALLSLYYDMAAKRDQAAPQA